METITYHGFHGYMTWRIRPQAVVEWYGKTYAVVSKRVAYKMVNDICRDARCECDRWSMAQWDGKQWLIPMGDTETRFARD